MNRLDHQSIEKELNMDLIKSFKKNIEELEKLYFGITRNYPDILSIIEDHIAEMKKGVSDSTNVQSSTMILNQHLLNYRTGIVKRDADNVEILHSIEFIEKLSNHIEKDILNIQDDSVHLELLSLNAMVAAIKSGKKGGAFPYLTKEMQKLSIHGHKKSDELLETGAKLKRYLSEMEVALNQETSKEEKSLKDLTSHAHKFLNSINDFDNYFCTHLETLYDEYSDIKDSTFRIIGELQRHDIIRQSLDHIILSIQFSENLPLNTLDDELDYLKFSKEMYQFSSHIIQEVIQDLYTTSKRFEANYNKISNSILSLDIDLALLNKIEEQMYEIQGVLQRNRNIKKSSKNNKNILKVIEDLTKISSDFSSIMKQIKMVNISNRIEYARNPEINGLWHIIDDIEHRSTSMEGFLESSEDAFNSVHKKILILFNKLKLKSNDNKIAADDFDDSMSTCLKTFKSIVLSMSERQSSFQSFIERFQILNQNIKNDLLEFEYVIDSFNLIVVFTEQEMKKHKRRMNSLLKQSGYETWSLKNVEVHDIIDKFTILTHKNSFSMGIESEIEQGASNGEIILF